MHLFLNSRISIGYYFPPPPKWSVASPDGEQPLTPFHIDVALSKFITEGQRFCPSFQIFMSVIFVRQLESETTAYQIHCDSQGGYIDGIEYTLQTTHRNPHGNIMHTINSEQ